MERDRLREVETLRERKAVSKFQQRGHIQALLKVRFLRRGTDARDDRSTDGTLSESNRVSNSAIMHIRERFNTGSQNGVADSRSLSREVAENTQESRNSTPNQQKVQNCDKDWEEEATNQNLVDSDCRWVSDYSHTPSGWDELQSNYQQQSESNQDWITDISRPLEEWEGLRQERYQEMLDPFLENHDIRQLLNRSIR